MIAAVDPGLNGCGVAVFYGDNSLARAEYVKNPLGAAAPLSERIRLMVAAIDLPHGAHLITECPQIYAAGKGKGNPNQLVLLAEMCAGLACTGHFPEWTRVYPREWKGTLNGDAMIERIKSRLTSDEMERVYFKGKTVDHNILDACGLGLWYLGRLTPRKVVLR